jgi:hypothetical protein
MRGTLMYWLLFLVLRVILWRDDGAIGIRGPGMGCAVALSAFYDSCADPISAIAAPASVSMPVGLSATIKAHMRPSPKAPAGFIWSIQRNGSDQACCSRQDAFHGRAILSKAFRCEKAVICRVAKRRTGPPIAPCDDASALAFVGACSAHVPTSSPAIGAAPSARLFGHSALPDLG